MLAQCGCTSAIGKEFDHTVASVAPPRLITSARGNAALTSAGSPSGTQSPLKKTSLKLLASLLCAAGGKYGTSCWSAGGAESQKVIFSLQSISTSRLGSRKSDVEATWIVPPAASIPKMS